MRWNWARINSSPLGGPGKPWRGISNGVEWGLTKTPALGSRGIIKAGRSRGSGEVASQGRAGTRP